MSVPQVYQAISAVAAELARKGIAKSSTNDDVKYHFRSIDDVYNRLSPALAAHKLCILPRVLKRNVVERSGSDGQLLVNISVKTGFDVVSAEDGSVHVIEAFGEAIDSGDKGPSKAMTAAFKYAVIQAFCIPVQGMEDADASTHRLGTSGHVPEPVQGWEQWVRDVEGVVKVCETGDALDRVQSTNRPLFTSISRERPDLYQKLGAMVQERRAALRQAPRTPPQKPARKRKAAKVGNGADAHG